jgi:FkbM family methyltransferase
MPVSLYGAKRALLAPRTAYMRRKSKDMSPLGQKMLDAQYYRRPMYAFMTATAANPDILVEADIDERSIVLDVGAFVGEWSEQISNRYGSTIYAFEPNPSALPALARRLANRPNVVRLEYGLGAADYTATMILAGPGSSIYSVDPELDTAEVQIRDVVGVLDELGIREVDLLKVNIEGGEYDLFDRLIESDWLPRVRLVSVQFHEWHPKAYRRRRAIRRALARSHTEVWCYPWVWEYWQRTAGWTLIESAKGT